MISPQPHGLWNYLGKKQKLFPKNIARKLYLSWEDALWDLLEVKKVPHGSMILLPDFFCMDVVGNMKNHGLTCIFYPVDQSFRTKEAILLSHIRKYQPKIIVIFHAVGIENSLVTTEVKWLSSLSSDQILIEDSVHRVIDPTKVKILRENHFVIDSLQKVLPLPGSFIYGRHEDLDFKQRRSFRTFPYELSVLFWWFLMQIALELKIFNFGEYAMLKVYDIIGDSTEPGQCLGFVEFLHQYIDFEKIKIAKRKQGKIYQQVISSLVKNNPKRFFSISLGDTDCEELRGYPLGIFPSSKNDFLLKIRAKGLLLREELADSPWSKDKRVVYLPLGPCLSISDVQKIIQRIFSALIQ